MKRNTVLIWFFLLGVGKSSSPSPTTALIPISLATYATSSSKKYMSLNVVVPDRIISTAASCVPSRTVSSLIYFASAGQK
jgi:hypothetical protein